MSKVYGSIYKIARNNAGLTQAQAASLLNVGTRTLGGYEACKPRPNDDIVWDMVKIYKTLWLGYEHLRTGSELGMMCLPPINIDDIAKSVLTFQKESDDVNKINRKMVAIACDGKIEDHEIDDWNHVSKELLEMAGAAMSVVFSNNVAQV